MKKAILIIDLQNDYFSNGAFPLWNADNTLLNIKNAITLAKEKNIPIIHIQHIANPENGISPFFNKNTHGVEIHPEILAEAPSAPIVIKQYADSFHKTNLEEILAKLEITDLLVCGMMTQNCVTHTAISKSAEKYNVTILADCCTTVSEMLHLIALHAVSTRTKIANYKDVI